MKPACTWTLVILFVCGPLFSQNPTIASGRAFSIFASNFSGSIVSLRLGTNTPALFRAENLPPAGVTHIAFVTVPGNYQLYFRTSSSNTEHSPHNEAGKPYLYVLNAGKSYLVRILTEDSADLIELSSSDNARPVSTIRQDAKICFINASPLDIPLIQIAKAWNQFVVVSMKNLSPHESSNFGSITPLGEYGYFWKSEEMSSNEPPRTLVDPKGKPILNGFTDSSWWALVIYSDSGTNSSRANLVNISPLP